MASFKLTGKDHSATAESYAKSVSGYCKSITFIGRANGASIITAGSYSNNSSLLSKTKSILDSAFSGDKEDYRSKFGTALAESLDDWFMNINNMKVIAIMLSGNVSGMPAVPNKRSSAFSALRSDLIEIFEDCNEKNPVSSSNFEKKFNDAHKKYFKSFMGSVHVFQGSGTKGYISSPQP